MPAKTNQRRLARLAVLLVALGLALAAPGPAAAPTASVCIPVPSQLTPAWGSGSICGG
jgi:hypothetical protein